MFIKSITIDGFKSYAKRTEISDFDQQFNAITGLNGSGKSNILDALCFLLGITTLSQMRVTNLQELVYKSGHSGISKASVCIVFDNHSKRDSPPGYEGYDEIVVSRQIVIGGRNRYLINGVNATNTRVLDMFASVRLNINNPNFLIMQGRITKVLNMKPSEILSLIEEAVGTSLYESKRAQAHKIMGKKEHKLIDINKVIEGDIEPLVSKLSSERSSYSEYQRILRDLDKLKMMKTALLYTTKTDQISQLETKIAEAEKILKENKNQIKSHESEAKELKEIISALNSSGLHETVDDGVAELQSRLDQKIKENAKISAQQDSRSRQLHSDRAQLQSLHTLRENESDNVQQRQIKLTNLSKQHSLLLQESSAVEKKLKEAKAYFIAISTGVDSDGKGTLQHQMAEAQHSVSELETQIMQAKLVSAHIEKNIRKAEEELGRTDDDSVEQVAEIEGHRGKLRQIREEIEQINFDRTEKAEIVAKIQKTSADISQLKQNVGRLESRSSVFTYRSPCQNFEKNHKVYGVVANLIKLKDRRWMSAIEVAGGSRLLNVIVDTEETAKLLLKGGKLHSRVTFVPLNKIVGHRISSSVLRTAKEMGGEENVELALDCVEYDPALGKAMEYVFGGVLVCRDLKVARTVVFNRNVGKKAVTLDGDLVEPSGSLTGGSRNQSDSILMRISRLNDEKSQLESRLDDLRTLEKSLEDVKTKEMRFDNLTKSVDLAESKIKMLSDILKHSEFHSLTRECAQLKDSLGQNRERLAALESAKHEAGKTVESIQQKLNKLASGGANLENEAEEAMGAVKREADVVSGKLREVEGLIECSKMDLEYSNEELRSIQAKIDTIDRSLQQQTKEFEICGANFEQLKREEREMEVAVLEEKERIRAVRGNLDEHNERLKTLTESVKDIELNVEQTLMSCRKYRDTLSKERENLKVMEEKNVWIREEKSRFGVSGGPFDFSLLVGDTSADSKLAQLEASKDSLCSKVNMRALGMLESVERKYNALKDRRNIILSDREKINDGIDMMDVKKKETLELAFGKVNKDFSAIFTSLLPSAKAELVAHNRNDLSQGVEFRVGFGNIWKDSLSELSGGQKSLVALSLILALLRLNPSPIYILDEIDAALDLSHTQNIGSMIKRYFKNSQFVIVSLKENMFSNANVLFKTKFVDGLSTVTRFRQLREDHNES